MVENTIKHEWSVTPLKDELTGDLSYEFTFPVGDGTTGSLELRAGLLVRTMASRLASRTRMLPDKAIRERFVQELIEAAPIEFVSKARQPGFKWHATEGSKKPEAFVTPGQIVGSGASKYRAVASSKPHLGQVDGDRQAWSGFFGRFAQHSSYVAFSGMAALAGPLLPFVNLSEDPAFNFAGPSSGGKTGAVRAGASLVGHPDSIRHWATTERRLEEVAAAHNHSMLVLNAAEKATPKRRLEILTAIVHMITERQSTTRSEAVQDRLPDLMWRTLVLSTSNKTGAEMAKEHRWNWDVQEMVRFIDIAVPGPKQGGVFDRYVGSKNSTELILELEAALASGHHGLLLGPWVEFLLAKNPTRRIKRLMDRFMRITGPHTGADERVARKFALIYAAGRMAIAAGLLGWSIKPLQTTRDLLQRARELRTADAQKVDRAVDLLLDAMRDPNRVPLVKPGAKIRVGGERRVVGVRPRWMGRDRVGLRLPRIPSIVGPEMAGPVMTRIKQSGALEPGHGGKSTQQLPITLVEDGEVQRKPRFLVIDPTKLAATRKSAA